MTLRSLIVLIGITLCSWHLIPSDIYAQSNPLTPEAQAAFLEQRTSAGMMRGGFNSFASYLYAVKQVTIHTDSPEVSGSRLNSPFESSYQPTWRELFDAIAKQTKSTWSYDRERRLWVFSKPLPFSIDIAKGWISEPRDGYMFYKPPTAPVGMDIYFAGEMRPNEKMEAARERIAVEFAQPISQSVKRSDMSEVTIGSETALYFTTKIQETRVIWRQWAIVNASGAFVIVSAIKPEDEGSVLPDVQKMVQSFRVLTPEKAS